MTDDTSQIEAVLSQLQKAGVAYTKKIPGAREKLMSLSYDLISRLESPSEAIMRMGWAEPARTANCRIAVDLDIFGHMKQSGAGSTTASELAAKCNADEALISRMMKHLATMNVVSETGDNTYKTTPLAEALTKTSYRDGVVFLHDVAGVSFQHLPKYLKNVSYTQPTEVTNGPFQAAHKTELSAFSWLEQTPPYLQAFNSYMADYRSGKPSWVDHEFYPVSDRLIKGFNSDYSEVFLVDVGGGKGHDLLELKEKYPHIPGRLILQDRLSVITTAVSDDIFEAICHDFFTVQPVMHARTYFLHSILHNWGDNDCIRILQQIKPAMKPGYSRLLLNEIVMPLQNATWPMTSMDQLMLILAASRERTEAHLTKLLQQAGFSIVKIYSDELSQESLVEAKLDLEHL